MNGNERDVHIQRSANRILSDGDAVAAYAHFVDAQLRYRRIRAVLAWLRALVWVLTVAVIAFLSACVLSPVPEEEAALRNRR
jgi:hypothetical protein